MKSYLDKNLNLKKMKKIIILMAGVLLTAINVALSNDLSEEIKETRDFTQAIYSTPDLFSLSQQWTSNYIEFNPGSTIKLLKANPDEFAELLSDGTSLGIISDRYVKSFNNSNKWLTLVGREILVPIINLNNPLINEIEKQGLSKKDLILMLDNSSTMTWGSLLDNEEKIPMNFYYVRDKQEMSEISKYFEADKLYSKGTQVINNIELVKSIQNDPNAIGFCKLTEIIKSGNLELIDNIRLLPIDKNGNGKIDYSENIYNSLNDFMRGIWIGKYPKDLINEIFIVSNSSPKSEVQVALIKWLLTDGQQILYQNGFSELTLSERLSKLEKINYLDGYEPKQGDQYANYKLLLIAVILVVVLLASGLIINIIIKRRNNYPGLPKISDLGHQKIINENTLSLPKGLYFDKTHTWSFMEKDGIVRIGIDDFLHHITGPFTRIKMRNPGESITKNEYLFSLIQDGKQLNIYAPFSGKIIDTNESLITNPSLINKLPYSEGWIYKIEPSNWVRETQFLKMAESYKEWIKTEFLRIKDFLSTTINKRNPEFNFITYQEGGELKDNVLKDFGPEVWEDFQKNFIDTSVMN